MINTPSMLMVKSKTIPTLIFILLCCQTLFQKWVIKPNIIYIKGNVRVLESGVEKLAEYESLTTPLRIITGESSFSVVSISFGQEEVCKITIYPDSGLEVSRSEKIPQGVLRVFLSDLSGTVILAAKNCEFNLGNLKILNGTVRLRHTPNKKIAEVLNGLAYFNKIELKTGWGIDSSSVKPYILNSEPEIVLPKEGKIINPFYLLWKRNEKSRKYFVEISISKDFENILFFTETEENKFFPSEITMKIMSDVYYWRVWYIDEEQKGSLFSKTESFKIKK